jgi:hypothetical protein
LPDRHIFRVGSDGAAHPTGTLAPKEPSRAIAPLRQAHPPAVEPPPPSLTAPPEEARKTKPARRRRGAASASAGVAGELEASAIAALPAPEKAKRTRKKAQPAAGEAKPRRTRAKKTETAENDGEVKKTARKRKTSK